MTYTLDGAQCGTCPFRGDREIPDEVWVTVRDWRVSGRLWPCHSNLKRVCVGQP